MLEKILHGRWFIWKNAFWPATLACALMGHTDEMDDERTLWYDGAYCGRCGEYIEY